MRTQREKRRAVGKTSVFLDNTYVILHKILVEVCTVKTILMRSQMEMRTILLKTGGKVILVVKCQRTCLSYVHILVLWKVELVSNETGYLPEIISKHSVEGMS